MRKGITLVITLFFIQLSSSQEQANENDFQSNYINIGTSVLDVFRYSVYVPAIQLGYEHKFNNVTSVGLNVELSNTWWPKDYRFKVGTFFSYNYDVSKKIGIDTDKNDLYGGLTTGITFRPIHAIFLNFAYGGQLGYRRFVSEQIGLYSEVRLVNRNYQVISGVTYRL